jgi:drug/metabolite transporter (DMT)-like permease
MSWGILFGLGSALSWGVADFLGGLQSRRLAALAVAFWSQLVGGTLLLLVLLLLGPPVTTGWAWAMAAGISGGLAVLLFYRALAIGTMAIVAPITAAGALVPVLVGLAQGERFGLITTLGIVAALLGVALASIQFEQAGEAATRATSRLSLVLALGAALGFGLFFTLIDRAAATPGSSPLWLGVWGRVASVPLLGALLLSTTRSFGWPGRALPLVGLAGVLDTAANVLFTLGARAGALGVVAVLSSLYPVITVLLSWTLLSERLTRLQYAGVALALSGVVLLAAG